MFADGKLLLKLSKDATSDHKGLIHTQKNNSITDNLDFPKDYSVTLVDILSQESPDHQRLIRNALKYIQEEGRVPPNDLWQYQVRFNGHSCSQ